MGKGKEKSCSKGENSSATLSVISSNGPWVKLRRLTQAQISEATARQKDNLPILNFKNMGKGKVKLDSKLESSSATLSVISSNGPWVKLRRLTQAQISEAATARQKDNFPVTVFQPRDEVKGCLEDGKSVPIKTNFHDHQVDLVKVRKNDFVWLGKNNQKGRKKTRAEIVCDSLQYFFSERASVQLDLIDLTDYFTSSFILSFMLDIYYDHRQRAKKSAENFFNSLKWGYVSEALFNRTLSKKFHVKKPFLRKFSRAYSNFRAYYAQKHNIPRIDKNLICDLSEFYDESTLYKNKFQNEKTDLKYFRKIYDLRVQEVIKNPCSCKTDLNGYPKCSDGSCSTVANSVSCPESCGASGSACWNQFFTGVLPVNFDPPAGLKLFKTERIGIGLLATKAIAPDTVIGELVGTVQKANTELGLDEYRVQITGTSYELSVLKTGNYCKYCNHCDEQPNTEAVLFFTQDGPHVLLITKNHIFPYTELTYDYGGNFGAMLKKRNGGRCFCLSCSRNWKQTI